MRESDKDGLCSVTHHASRITHHASSPNEGHGRHGHETSHMYDLLIRNGLILDGTGGAPFVGDVGLVGERIEAMGALPGPALRTLDANGYAVAPGFIDMHSHTD